MAHHDGIGRRPRAALTALGLLSAFGPISTDLYLPALPEVGPDLGTSPAGAQLTLSAALVGLAVGQLVVGPLSDRVGRRLPLLVGLAGFALMSVACALAPTVGLLVAARVLQGMCGAAGLVVARAVVRDAYPDRRIGEVFSLLMLVNGMAPVLAPLVGGGLLHLVPWRGLFWLLALVGVALGLLTAAVLPETLDRSRRHAGGLRQTATAARVVLSDRAFLGATAVLALASGTLFTYISLGSFVLQSGAGLSPTAFSVVFAVNSIGIVAAGRLSSLLVRRMSPAAALGRGLVVMTAATAVLVVAALAAWPLAVQLPALFVAIATVGVVFPNAITVAMLGQVGSAGTASALLGALQYLAGALAGPLVSTAGVSAVSMSLGMLVAAGAATVLWAVVVRRPAAAVREIPAWAG